MTNPYLPHLLRIDEMRPEVLGARAITTFRVAKPEGFDNHPGQCAMVGLLGKGESMFAISTSPTRDCLEFSVMKLGKVTSALHASDPGDTITVRGPYGHGFPVDEWRGRNLILIGGGVGQPPLRSILHYALDNRADYGDICVVYGARSTADLCYRQEFAEIVECGAAACHLSIDVAEEGWGEFVGFVPDNLMRVAPSPDNAIAVTCGPPIMIRFVLQNLERLGFADDQIYTTLEKRMKCGIKKCGRCNVGNVYVCQDGPVFSLAQLKQLPPEL